ncbi:unnamed protein product [Orchesella dallaii]|uniref:Uncharacterized protein n=1 Tax=Orchesella dallaii TaxID=48710 RepID=A0ABP1S8C0_9HEXA
MVALSNHSSTNAGHEFGYFLQLCHHTLLENFDGVGYYHASYLDCVGNFIGSCGTHLLCDTVPKECKAEEVFKMPRLENQRR